MEQGEQGSGTSAGAEIDAVAIASRPLADAPKGSDPALTSVATRRGRRLTLYRDDSTAQVVYTRVKSYFFTASNTVLTIARYDSDQGDAHHYIHWPRERFCWFKDWAA